MPPERTERHIIFTECRRWYRFGLVSDSMMACRTS